MNSKINTTIMGVGPGNSELLPAQSVHRIQNAGIVAGFTTVNKVLSPYIGSGTTVINLNYRNQEAEIDAAITQALAENKDIVFTLWGDFNFSGNELVERYESALSGYKIKAEYIPGISAVQMALTRLRLPMEDSIFITLHRRNGLEDAQNELLNYCIEGKKHLILLPHTFDMMPAQIADFLLQNNFPPDKKIVILEKLSYPDESLMHTTLKELAGSSKLFSDLSVIGLPKA